MQTTVGGKDDEVCSEGTLVKKNANSTWFVNKYAKLDVAIKYGNY